MGCTNSSTNIKNEANPVTSSNQITKEKENKQSNRVSLTNNNQNLIKLKNIFNPNLFEKHYEIIEKIGTGSFGKVYKVRHFASNQERALKIVNRKLVELQDDEQEFLKEIEMLYQLDHPNIIKVFEYFIKGSNYYVIQELCNGGELYEQIYYVDSFTETNAASIIYQIVSAVYYLHSMNIVHRDLKPENIMLESKAKDDFSIKLIDFGTANYCYKNKNLNQKVGTSYYIAPEVIMKNYNQKCDVWSIGVILYILLSGFPPFDGDNDEEIMEAVISEEISFDDPEWKIISSQAIAFLRKLLSKNPNDRVSSEECLKNEWLCKHIKDKNKENEISSDKINLLKQVQNFQKYDSKLKLKNAIMGFLVHHLATEEMTKELKTVFKKMDKSGDGRLSLDELKQGFAEIYKVIKNENIVTEIDLERRFKAMDSDNSGYIEIEEFIRATINEELLMNEKNFKMTFDYFDKDKSGQLDCEEIEDLLQSKTMKEDNKILVRELIDKYDQNKDGVLSFAEFKELIKEFQVPGMIG